RDPAERGRGLRARERARLIPRGFRHAGRASLRCVVQDSPRRLFWQIDAMMDSSEPDLIEPNSASLTRRQLVSGAAALAAAGVPLPAHAAVPVPYSWDAEPPSEPRAAFVDWMTANRGEDPTFLGRRWDRFRQLVASHDIWGSR